MGLLEIRDDFGLPAAPGNESDTIHNEVHYNRTTLLDYSYTLYANDTISNRSKCYLVLPGYTPYIFPNGTWVNSTSCYDPYYPIGQRGALGITFACLFGISIVFTMIHLRKHGRMFLPAEKRFRPVGRRWQWYWLFFVAACGMISGITGIDVDRAYLQSTPIILQNFFYFMLSPGILAAVWEAVRHWGSWQERQLYDGSPFSLPQTDRRAKIEFYLPLVFYLFAFLNFFMTIPRSWTQIQFQRSEQQITQLAKPQATDARFKAGAILSIFAIIIICVSLRFSIHHYKPRSSGVIGSTRGFFRHAPVKFLLMILLLVIKNGYQIAIAWDWYISPLKSNSNSGWLYGLGYSPVFLIVVIMEIWGYIDKNEDRTIIAQRRLRGELADQELGYMKKPSWWSTHITNRFESPEERLKAMNTVGGGTATRRNIERNLELQHMSRTEDAAIKAAESGAKPQAEHARDSPLLATVPSGVDRARGVSSTRSNSSTNTERTLSNAQPQQVRSMLDI